MTRGTAAALAAKNATTTHTDRYVVRRRPGPHRSRREPSPAGRQYHRPFLAWPGARRKASRAAARVVAGLATRRRAGEFDQLRTIAPCAKSSSRRAGRLALQPIVIEVAAAGELESAIAEMARRRAQALLVPGDGLFIDNRVPLMSAALRYALPTVTVGRDMVRLAR